MEKVLSDLYYNVRTGYSNPVTLYRAAKRKNPKVSQKDVEKWLSAQNAYTLHKPARRRYKRNKIIVSCIDDLWQVDLADMSNIANHNDGFKYILTCIDCFSKHSWAVPTKTKGSLNVTDAMKTILNEGRVPYKLQSDRGKEFLNKDFQNLLKVHEIEYFTTNNETKCSIVERFNRTLKEKMYKYFTHSNSYRYVDVLDDLLYNYNHSKHRTIGYAPSDVDESNENEIYDKVFQLEPDKITKFKFQLGDTVRVNKLKRFFDKGYTWNWSEEIFTISKRYERVPPVYSLKDCEGEDIEGVFYEKELQKVIKTDGYHVVEKVLKQRNNRGKTEYLVKWRGYPETMNSWVTDLKKL